jgi:hypothetical protein
LLAAIGWVVFFFMFRTENALDLDDVESETAPCHDTVEAPDQALQGPLPPSENERFT